MSRELDQRGCSGGSRRSISTLRAMDSAPTIAGGFPGKISCGAVSTGPYTACLTVHVAPWVHSSTIHHFPRLPPSETGSFLKVSRLERSALGALLHPSQVRYQWIRTWLCSVVPLSLRGSECQANKQEAQLRQRTHQDDYL